MSNQVNRERVKQWVEALRSGKYQQGRDSLRSEKGYCCLGVACEISGLGTWEGSRYVTESGSSNALFLPDGVSAWYGLDDSPTIPFALLDAKWEMLVGESVDDLVGLADLNDNDMAFAEIADVIERAFLKDEAAQ